MRQAALTLGSAPDCGTFIYTLKVPHTHPPMPKSKGLTRPGFAMQSYIVIVSFAREKSCERTSISSCLLAFPPEQISDLRVTLV